MGHSPAAGGMTPRLLTLAEAAKLVNRQAASLRQAVLRGSLPAQKLGRDWFVKESDLKKYMHRAGLR